jgi:hypothetical protein
MARVEPNISREALFERLDYNPHNGQWPLHRATQRFRAACCGRRFGKSQWAGRELTLKMFVPQSINWIVGPEYALGEKEFRVVWNDFKKLGLLGRCKKQYNLNQGRMSIFFPELESLLEVKSEMKPDSLVGEGLDHVCMSESAKLRRSTWQMYIRPALADKHGSADFPSTPQGFNWYAGMYDMGQSPDFPEFMSARHPSWENSVLFPGGENDPEILQQKKDMSEMLFRQEIAAEFTAFEGQIYPEFQEEIHVKNFNYDPDKKNWLALDFGYVDPFVCLDIMIDPTDDRVYVWREYMESYRSTHEHGLILARRDNPPEYKIDGIAADPRGADEIATISWVLGTISHNAVGWAAGVEEIKKALKVREDGRPGLLIHPSCTNLIRQMKNLRAKEVKEGHNEKQGQHDYDDHGPDALRYFFNEYFVLGGGGSIKDIYGAAYQNSEASSFFHYEGGLVLSGREW